MQQIPFLHQRDVLVASLLVALSAVLYGFLGYLGTRIIANHISITEMQFWRFLVATLWLSGFALRQKLPVEISKRLLTALIFLGAVSYAGTSHFYFVAAQSIGTGLAMVIFFSYPAMIVVAAFLFQRQTLRHSTLMVLTIMLVGLFFLRGTSREAMSLGGIFFGILSAALYAFYMIVSKQLSTISIPSSLVSVFVCLGSTICFMTLSPHSMAPSWPAGWESWIDILLLGIVATALPIQLMLLGLKHISSLRASIISVLEPLITVIVGLVLLNESLSAQQMLGGVMVLVSALVIQFQKEL